MASSTGSRLTPSGKRLTKGAISQYKCVRKLIFEFQEEYSVILRIQLIHRSSLRDLKKEKLYWKRFFRDFTIFLYKKKNCHDHYVGSVFKIVKTFFNFLSNDKALPVGNFHKQFRLPAETFTPIVLEPYQLNFLITDELFHKSLPGNLQRTKDFFVFGCTVGLRVSDLLNLKKQNIQCSDSGNFINLSTEKTGTDIKIPLPDYLMEIISKYNRKKNKYLLPRLSITNLNLHIKRIIEKAGWIESIVKLRHKQGKPIEIKNKNGDCFRFCDHITTHTMRRTAITTLLLMGVPETMVRKISGHAAGSKEFFRYVAIVQDYLNDEVKIAFNKILNAQKAA